MQFLFQPLTWGFLLVGVPILVHLINMLRHRKQKWAAMDFLLESYRRNRRWVMLKQWLLLACRMLAMVLLVAMLAKWISGAQWLSWLGGQTTHHYLLLDDSYSMAEVDQNQTAYARGLQALNGIVRSIAAKPGQHQVTLLRWSRADLALSNPQAEARLDAAADLLAQSVPNDPGKLLDRLNATQPVALQLSPEQSLELVSPLISENADQQSEVYLITDMRRNEFGEPERLRNQLQALTQNSANLHVIDCAHDAGTNLSIVSVEPEREVWAAGVPFMVRFQVRNRTGETAKNTIVRVRAITYPPGTSPQVDKPYSGEIMDLPPVVIEQISAGETVTRQVQVVFGLPGNHVVEVSIADDVLNLDNRRWCTLEIKQSQRVLLVDGEVDQSNAFFFEKVIRPGEQLSTGMQLEKYDSAYLRDVSPEALQQFDVIGLLDVPRLDPQAVEKLEAYCRGGGGILMVCGRNTNLKFVNEQLYRNRDGFFPVKLESTHELSSSQSGEPLIQALPHPVLGSLLLLESSPFTMVNIRQMHGVQWSEADEASSEVVATGPGRRPLILDTRFGNGRVLTLLTGLTPDWSDWAQDPTFVVFTLQSLGYLSSFQRPPTSYLAGTPIEMTVREKSVLPEAELLIPGYEDGMRLRIMREVEQDSPEEAAKLRLGVELEFMDRDLLDSLLRPGVFEAWLVSAQGDNLVENFAHNVPAAEGDLERVARSEFEQKMRGIPFEYRTAEAVSGTGMNSQDAIHSTLLMCLLGALLLGEQALAYSASYHTPKLMGARR